MRRKLLGMSFVLAQGKAQMSQEEVNVERNALCILYPDNNSGVSGLVSFHQKDFSSKTQIAATVLGLNPNQLHGFHIHEFGDLSEGCKTAGAHYNPHGKNHGGYGEERHVGDLGNLKAKENGVAYMAVENDLVKLFGQFSVIGRSCVVHAGEDDLGMTDHELSKTTGNSGGRVACGVIGLSKTFKNLEPV